MADGGGGGLSHVRRSTLRCSPACNPRWLLRLGGSYDLEGAVDAVLRTPRTVLRRDLTALAASTRRARPLPSEARALADGEPSALRRLGGYHRCDTYTLSNWVGTGSHRNSQTGGVTANFYVGPQELLTPHRCSTFASRQ